MAGGTAAVTAVGAAVGGSLSASVSNAYVREDRSFRIELLRPGSGGVPVVVANGFLTDGPGEKGGGWRSIVEAPRFTGLSGSLGGEGTPRSGHPPRRGGRQGRRRRCRADGSRACDEGGSDGHWPGGGTGASWCQSREESVARGQEPRGQDWRCRGRPSRSHRFPPGSPDRHSLGAVMTVAAQVLGTRPDSPRLVAVHLLGAAIAAKGDWTSLAASVEEGAHLLIAQ